MCDRVKSLGCELHITHDAVHWSLTEEKKQKWIAAIDDALTSNTLTSGGSSKTPWPTQFRNPASVGKGRSSGTPTNMPSTAPHG